jgi:hypothetical protein
VITSRFYFIGSIGVPINGLVACEQPRLFLPNTLDLDLQRLKLLLEVLGP